MKTTGFAAMMNDVSGTRSRRQALRLFSGLGLAGLLGYAETEAKGKKHHGRGNDSR
jgi:hypothetical protein